LNTVHRKYPGSRIIRITFIIAALSSMLGCNNSDGGLIGTGTGPTDGTGTKIKIMKLGTEPVGKLGIALLNQNAGGGFASFIKLPESYPADMLENELLPIYEDCTFTRTDFEDISSLADDVDDESAELSAGEVITITGPSGSIGELVRLEDEDGSIIYMTDAEFGAIPAGSVLDIPGDEFPAFSNVALPLAAGTDVSGSTGERITADTQFSWTPGDTSSTYVVIQANTTTDSQSINLSCNLLNDGSYSFPADLRDKFEEVGENFSFEQFLSFSAGFQVQREGDALLSVIMINQPIPAGQ